MRPSEVLLQIGGKSQRLSGYVCEEPSCSVRYSSSHGYWVTSPDGREQEGEVVPAVSCPKDGALMYLAEVRPEQRSYRLWRCAACGTSLTNEELSRASNA